MRIHSPQFTGSVSITGSLTITGGLSNNFTSSNAVTASYATTASYVANASSFPYTGSATITGSLNVIGAITAQTIVVQTLTSSISYLTGSTQHGSLLTNTHQFTGSVGITGSLSITSGIINNLTSSNAVTASFATNATNAITASYASTAPYSGLLGTVPTWNQNTTGNAATATNSTQLNGISSTQIFNNMGNNHGTYTDANSVGGFGVRYLQGSTNGPGTGASQYYGFTLGLGNEYPYSGAGSYGTQLYWNRTSTGGNPYVSVRYNENGSYGAWSKIYAGYADSSGNSSTTSQTNFSSLTTNFTGTPYHVTFRPTANATFNVGQTTGNGATVGPFVNATLNGATDATSVPLFFNCSEFHVFVGYSEAMRLTSGGSLYIGSTITQNYSSWSDRKLKENLKIIANPLDKISKLTGYTFEWTKDSPYRNTPEIVNRIQDAGLIAQDVEEVLPEIVRTTKESLKTVNYDGVVALHTECIKELIKQNQELLERIKKLEEKLL
jgi:hypothetical protein